MANIFFTAQETAKNFFLNTKFLLGFDISDDLGGSFLITDSNKLVRAIKNCDDFQLPPEYDGYELKQKHDKKLPRIVVTHEEAKHFADIFACVRYDDERYSLENATRYFLGVTHSYYLSSFNLSRDELAAQDRQQLLQYLRQICTPRGILTKWGYLPITLVIRNTRNEMALKDDLQLDFGRDEYACGYLNLIKDGRRYSLYVKNPEIHGQPVPGPLPAILNVANKFYSDERYGPPHYVLRRCYGRVAYPVYDSHSYNDFYDPFC